MKEKYIKVVVSGLPKTGKTTIAELIGAALSDSGFDVMMETDGDDGGVPQSAISAMQATGIKIVVVERDAFTKKDDAKPGRGKITRTPQTAPAAFPGVDLDISCTGCQAMFTFTADEQQWYLAHNLDKAPRRCKACLSKKKNRTTRRE